jgi:hypothetical protein
MFPLHLGDQGVYGKLTSRRLPQHGKILFLPSLAALLTRAQQIAGRMLSRREVLRIRDASQILITDAKHLRAIVERRGYRDLDARTAYAAYLREIAELPRGRAARRVHA